MESAANNYILAERDTEERFACTKLAQRRSNLFDHLDDGRKPIDRDDATRGGGDSMEDGRAATPRYASNPPRARALKALKLPPTEPRVNYRLTPARKGTRARNTSRTGATDESSARAYRPPLRDLHYGIRWSSLDVASGRCVADGGRRLAQYRIV